MAAGPGSWRAAITAARRASAAYRANREALEPLIRLAAAALALSPLIGRRGPRLRQDKEVQCPGQLQGRPGHRRRAPAVATALRHGAWPGRGTGRGDQRGRRATRADHPDPPRPGHQLGPRRRRIMRASPATADRVRHDQAEQHKRNSTRKTPMYAILRRDKRPGREIPVLSQRRSRSCRLPAC